MIRPARVVMAVVLATCSAATAVLARDAPGAAPPTDFTGTWLPDARRAQAWPAQLPLAPAARRFMDTFDPSQSDPTTYCMPFGTPRNMLQTEYPLDIVQTPQRLVMVLQPNLANAEVRRIWLDGRELPASPDPSWFGTSRGHWESATLVVETVGMREDAIVSENGLPHSAALRVIERLRVETDPQHGKVLVDELELRDPMAYLQPIKTRRYYDWAPQARSRDSTCVDAMWSARLWRERLREHVESARQAPGAQ
jgi:hypothetical protein